MRGHLSALVLVAGLAGCASDGGTSAAPSPAPAPTVVLASPFAGVTDAVAAVGPVGTAFQVHGTVRFSQVAGGVRVTAEIEGLKPNAKHAFHIHEWGDVTCMDGKCAGGHYNPAGAPHGGPDSEQHHAGDLGNLETDAKGVARLDRVFNGLTIAGERDPILGRSVIIHAGEDDFTTQPTGIVGEGAARIARGVIGIAKPTDK
jgi:Cu-Zn family superoxide dismutase